MLIASASRALARALETGYFKGDFALTASRIWAGVAKRRLVRRLHVPDHVRVIAVGGATLGGSGKTPVAIAVARREAEQGRRVALVGHAYLARPEQPRVVRVVDDVRVVGDEALLCARELAGVAEVIVADSRQAAVDCAITRGAAVVVLDGVAQIAPRRADLALLVVDEHAGPSRACPPAGDLRAPIASLRAVSDRVVRVSATSPSVDGCDDVHGEVISDGARAPDGTLIPFAVLAKMRLGLALAIARPQRVVELLRAHAVVPEIVIDVGDHHGDRIRAMIAARARDRGQLDGWLISSKCAAFVAPTLHDTVPIYVVAHAIALRGALP